MKCRFHGLLGEVRFIRYSDETVGTEIILRTPPRKDYDSAVNAARAKGVDLPLAGPDYQLTKMAYNGWVYGYTQEIDGDNFEYQENYAINLDTGTVQRLRHSRYEHLSEAAFAAHVALGFPDNAVPWENASIIAEAEEYAE